MPDNNTSNPTLPGDLPIGALLRMCADGEILTVEQQSQIEAYCQENADKPCCMKFEQAMRQHIGTVMADASAVPESLRESVQQLAGQHDETPTVSESVPEPIVRSNVSFWLQQRWIPFAAAAAIVLAVSATFVLQSSNQLGLPMTPWIDATQQASLVSFLDAEHERVSTNEVAAAQKFTANTPKAAEELIRAKLGLTPCQLDLLELCQLGLVGAGGCGVPGDGESVHALYKDADSQQTLSVFIQQDPDATKSDPACLSVSQMDDGNEILAWRYQGLLYFVVCPDKKQVDTVMASLGAPEARSGL